MALPRTRPAPAGQPVRMSMRLSLPEVPVRDPLAGWWRGAVVLRVVTYGFAVGSTFVYDDQYARPALGWILIAALGVWTLCTGWCFLTETGRWLALTIADLVIACAVMYCSRLVFTHVELAGSAPIPLLTTVWVSGVVAAGAIRTGPIGGVLFGVTLAVFNYATHGYVDVDLTRDAVLLVATGLVIGVGTRTARRSAERLAHALRSEAATAERERLARSIHDSVLQVLARVQRRGAELGGEAAELARLAGEQEVALRALVSASRPESTPDGDVDLRALLQIMASPKVEIAVPGTRVMLPDRFAAEVAAVVREALSNVTRHAGPQAHAWVLLEDLAGEIVVSVRDDGPGIPAGRLAAAAAEGRLGVAKSIQGRVDDLDGQADLRTGDGTEWEFRLPKPKPGRNRGD